MHCPYCNAQEVLPFKFQQDLKPTTFIGGETVVEVRGVLEILQCGACGKKWEQQRTGSFAQK
jgi:hypothetical protein